MTDFHLEAEVRLIRWGESSSAGRTITLELHPDEGDGHPFKGFPTGQTHGQRFRVAFSAISDDEQPVSACAPLRERPAAPPSPRVGGGATSTKTPAERAVQRAGALPRDLRFRAWAQTQLLNDHADDPVPENFTEIDAAEFIRDTCCGGNSRSLIAEVPEYMDRFMEMLTAFQLDVGELPEPRG